MKLGLVEILGRTYSPLNCGGSKPRAFALGWDMAAPLALNGRVPEVVAAWAKNGRVPIRRFFPFGFAQGQNDGVYGVARWVSGLGFRGLWGGH